MCTTLLPAQIRFSWRGGIPVSGPWAALHWHSNCQYITCIELIRGLEIGQSGRWFPTPGELLHTHRTQTTSHHHGLRSSGDVFLLTEHEHTNIVKPVGVGRVVLPMLVGSRAPSTLLHQRPHILVSLRPWSAPTRARGHLLL